MNIPAISLQGAEQVELLRDACPFFAAEAATCRALLSTGKVEEKQLSRCRCDDHDACPRFLSRLLQAGRSWSTGPVLGLRHK